MHPSALTSRKRENFVTRVQFDGTNLNDRLNLINFSGLFSGDSGALRAAMLTVLLKANA
jgi:hypothetical protein